MRLVGDWTIRLLVITLALTPLQRVLNWPKISLIRRMLGVTTFAYALTHFTLYIVQSKFDLVFVASEIILRIYLTIGFVALIGLSLLAARRLIQPSANWERNGRCCIASSMASRFWDCCIISFNPKLT